MATKEVALNLVKVYQDLIGQEMKTSSGLVRIDAIEIGEWETGKFYDVFLVDHQKCIKQSNTIDEIRVCLFDYLDEKGLLHDLPDGAIKAPDLNQKYFTNNMDLAFSVAKFYSYLTKTKKKFRPTFSDSFYDINCVKVFVMPDMDVPSYQVLLCFDPLLNNTFIRKENLEVGIKTIDLLVFLQSEGIDITKHNHLKDFLQLYL